MSSKNNNEHFFDQDFEVTYEDDPIFHYEEEPLTKREFQTVDLKSQPKPPGFRQKEKEDSNAAAGRRDHFNGSDHKWIRFSTVQPKNPCNGKKNLTGEKIHHVQNARTSDSDDYEDETPPQRKSSSSKRKS